LPVPKLLIDGYNLLFQSDLVGRGRGERWLQKATSRLVKRVTERVPPRLLETTLIIFDRPQVGPAPPDIKFPSGLEVRYAVDHVEADDLLEEIIRQHPTPKLLTVVSSDQRVRRCARAKRAQSIDADTFLAQLAQPLNMRSADRNTAPQSSPFLLHEGADDSETSGALLPEEEVAYWVDKFFRED
jgi:predicted RNA-binding protein with PIN domain